MIIIAQPKSASSSLCKSLGLILGWPAVQDFIREHASTYSESLETCPFPHLSCLHSDFVAVTKSRVMSWGAFGYVFKQHTPPTPANLELFRGHKIVFLHRNPMHATDAYLRAAGMNHLKRNLEFRANVRREMAEFQTLWRQWGSEDPENFLELSFAQVTTQQRDSVQKICNFWELGVTVPENFVLSKQRYSRNRKIKRSVRGKKK